MKELLSKEDYKTLSKHLKHFFKSYYNGDKQNLTHYLESEKLQDSLNSDDKKKLFFTALYDILYGENTFENRFTNWIQSLQKIGQAKWTIATIFLFIVHPNKHMFVKPNTTKNALEICGFGSNNYNSLPSYSFYSKVLSCSDYIFAKTKELGMNPKDMIDVQSFMWRIHYEPKETEVKTD